MVAEGKGSEEERDSSTAQAHPVHSRKLLAACCLRQLWDASDDNDNAEGEREGYKRAMHVQQLQAASLAREEGGVGPAELRAYIQCHVFPEIVRASQVVDFPVQHCHA